MMYLIPLGLMLWIYALWVLYLAVQSLIVNRPKLAPWVNALGVPPYLAALVLDVLLNWVFMTVLFYEFPREWTVSTRLSRHHQHGFGWRQKFSGWVGKYLLDPFDPTGKHI